MTTRRDVLGAGGVLAALAAAASRPTSATTPDWRQEAPEHVDYVFDEAWLKHYRPLLVTRNVDMNNVNGLYGMRVGSSEWDVDVGVYAMSYSTQDGGLAPPIGLDQHFGDHEWFYSVVDSSTGELVEVDFANYHWIVGRAEGENIPTYEQTHPKARIDPRWHNFYLTEEEGAFIDLDDLTAAFQGWRDNGMAEHLALEAVTRPILMRGARNHWWQSGFDATYAEALYKVGLAGADNANPEVS